MKCSTPSSKRRGFEVTTTTVPENALHRLAEGDFDLVLTDINMHGMSGVDLCQKIVQSREDLPVVVMTAYGSMEVGDRRDPGGRLRLRDEALRDG